jgi:DNA-binding winged helix-turn-helix (wHTH) protein/tetratricopeptide (TPR) repeat protein
MEPASRPSLLRFGPYTADLRAGELTKNGAKIRLQEKSLRVLAALAEQQGQLVTRDELKKRLWPDETFVDFETGLNTAVSKLRDALCDDAEKPRYIETIPRRGYRFLMPVEILEERGSSQIVAEAPALREKPAPAAAPEPPSADLGQVSARIRASRTSVWLWVAAVVALLAGGAYWLLQGHPAFSFHSQDAVLIADFENQTGDPRFDNALATAFTVSIRQSRYANAFPRTRVDGVLKRMGKNAGDRITASVGREVCQRENIRGLIVCSITRTGQVYALTAELVDPQSGETVRSYTERSYGEDHILDALDVLAREIREALGESLYQIHRADKPLPQVTTRSLNALQQYADAQDLWQHAKYNEAVTLYKAAIAGDPDFAMAHAALGGAYYSHLFNQPDEGHKEYEAALSQASRTTERERMIIETRYAQDRNHLDEAVRLFSAYLNRYPDDSVMRYDYGNLLRVNGRYRESIEQYEQAARVAPNFANIYINLATAYKALGEYAEALREYEKAFALEPQFLSVDNLNREYGFTLVANGEDQKAEQVFTALLAKQQTQESGLHSLAFLDLYHGRYASARRRLEQVLALNEASHSLFNVSRAHLQLSIVAEGQGDAKRQRQELDAATAALKDIQAKVIYGAFLGDAYARAGVTGEAEKIAAIIRPLADPSNSEQMGYLHLLEGEIALAAGQGEKAISLLTQADKENRTGFSGEALAHAYQQSGNLEKATFAYEEMLKGPIRSLGWEPQQRWLEAHYMLAQDYSARGDREKARQAITAFLNLWKDADTNLPLRKKALELQARLSN